MPASRTRRILTNVLVFSGSILVFLLALEGVTRLAWPQPVPFHDLYVNDPDTVYRLAPDRDMQVFHIENTFHISTNKHGLRDSPIDPSTGLRNILFLGDSFTFGYEVDHEEIFVEIVENELNGKDRVKVQCLNTGVPGHGTYHQLQLLKKLDSSIAINGVILSFFLGNDFQDNNNLGRRRVENGFLVDSRAVGRFRVRKFFHVHSNLYRLVTSRLKALLQQTGGVDHEDPRAAGRLSGAFGLAASETTEPFLTTFGYVRQLKDFCAARGIPFGLVLIPASYQLTDAEFQQFAAASGPEPHGRAHPNDVFRGFAAREGIPLLDLLPVLETMNEPLYFPIDGHFNQVGHLRAAEAIVEVLLPLMPELAIIDAGKAGSRAHVSPSD